VRLNEITPLLTTGDGPLVRQDLEAGISGLRTIVTHQFGATFGQSIGDYLVLATTLRFIRAGESFGSGGSIDEADDLDADLESSGDLDIGAMAIIGAARFGVSVKHLREPEFGEGPAAFVLRRQARAGVAWMFGQPGAPARMTLAADGDLTRTVTAFGEARHLAGGVEFSLPGPQLAFRTGVSANTVGDSERSASVGGSVGLYRGFVVDGAWTFGSDRSRKGWAFSFRLAL
jgi:hypothetical protein